jgi:hypothetical protein
MRASKRITLLAIGLWLVSCVIGSVFPWEVIDGARNGMDTAHNVLLAADRAEGTGRILLLGSSPVVLGISAKEIERRTGMPTFNIGVSDAAEFFDDYMSRVLPYIRKGDVVIVSDPRWLDPTRQKLSPGCTEQIAGNCLGWRFAALPHLSLAGRFVMNLHQPIGIVPADRDARGDNTAMDPGRLHKPVRTMPPPDRIAALDVRQMAGIVDELHRHDACPLLALGPVFVSESEQAAWDSQVSSLQSAVFKSGYGRFLLSDDVLRTDRADFLDSYEHPSALGRSDWTNRIIARLMDRSMGPCVSFSAAR